MAKSTDFAYYLTKYLTAYLSGRRGLSVNTVHSYRDTFKLLLIYCRDVLKISTGRLTLERINRQMIDGFLIWLEAERKLSASSLNQRLAAIHSFFEYLQSEYPNYILEYQRILAIKSKKQSQQLVGFLSKEALKLIFDSVDTSTSHGRRDLTLLTVLYDTGARVQELCDLQLRDLFLTDKPHVMLTGKGDKSRYVPIMPNTVSQFKAYLKEFYSKDLFSSDSPLFFNCHHSKLTRSGVSYVVKKYADIARQSSVLIPENITPHIFRHTKAMHLCQAGVDLIYIRDILGHVFLSTTDVYARINVERIRDAIERAYPELNDNALPDWSNDDTLMKLLVSL
jgi:site-specific recombinase XerD